MSVDEHPLIEADEAPGPIVELRPRRPGLRRRRRQRPPKPRLRKLRLLLILLGFVTLALVSMAFGMLMSVTRDLPKLENDKQYALTQDSYMYDDQGKPIGVFAPPNGKLIDTWSEISPAMVHAIVAVEDKRFWSDPGIDLKGLLRAAVSDVTGGPREGASTIAEQFVKNALAEQDNRTLLEKLREAALAFQLTHKWERTKILTEYLNTIYFGNGAYGIESAARIYYGWAHGYNASNPGASPDGCGPTPAYPHLPECAKELTYWQAALLAGMVADPSGFDPVADPAAALARRKQVLKDMLQQGYITHSKYEYGISRPLPTAAEIQQPTEPPAAPYFTSWLRPQIIAALEREGVPAKLAAYKAFYGGLKIYTTIDLSMQKAAQSVIDSVLPPDSGGPTATLVTIDNKTGEVRAMVSGNDDFTQSPFNLATLGHRQPGSAFKPFTLAEALQTGEYTPYSIIDSAPQDFVVPNSDGKEHFIVHNFGNTYSGPITLTEATAISDNSVYSQVGIHVGTTRIAHLAHEMGIRSPISTNYAMILGGLTIGVSALDMAHAYETLATGGQKVFNPVLGDMDDPSNPGPTGIADIRCPAATDCNFTNLADSPTYQRILPPWVVQEVQTILEGVVSPGGTATIAAIPGVVVAGKTGTTSDYSDAWFVGWTPQLTTAVWVGYPLGDVSMATDYNGGPVEGGTFPALIWHDYMVDAIAILQQEQAASTSHAGTTTPTTTGPATYTPSNTSSAASAPTTAGATPAATTPAATTGGATTGGATTGGATTGGPTTGAGTTGGPTTGGGTTGGGGATSGGTSTGSGGAGLG
ncbi:MAG: transglycosylase domain-containing protein [Solirubrobacteraceae bacterium]